MGLIQLFEIITILILIIFCISQMILPIFITNLEPFWLFRKNKINKLYEERNKIIT